MKEMKWDFLWGGGRGGNEVEGGYGRDGKGLWIGEVMGGGKEGMKVMDDGGLDFELKEE